MMKRIMLVLGPAVSLLLWERLSAMGVDQPVARTAAITMLTALWWITEALPIPATSLIPFAAFPLAGVMTHQQAAGALGSHVIVLLMGAFMLSKALEKSGVHERLALMMIRAVGGRGGARLVLAFMLTAAILSMWISNTATTLMLLPIASAILARVENDRLKIVLLLAIAYSASVGGIGTPIGTTPNVLFLGVYQEISGAEYGFVNWMKTGVPVALLSLPLMALWLMRGLGRGEPVELPVSGRWRKEELRVLAVFALAILAWVTRGSPESWGWAKIFNISTAGDSTVALLAAILMFLVPNGKGGRLLDWETASSIPWGVLLLFAGGIAIARAFDASGLSQILGASLIGLSALPVFAMMFALALSVSFLTEITSNTATTALLMPILAAAALGAGIKPELFMIPAAISASCAFMLPVATGPNAIVYATGAIRMGRMMREGLALNFILALVVAAVSYVTLT